MLASPRKMTAGPPAAALARAGADASIEARVEGVECAHEKRSKTAPVPMACIGVHFILVLLVFRINASREAPFGIT